MLFAAITVIIVAIFLYEWYESNKHLPPGPWGIPLLGMLPFLNFKDPIVGFSNIKKKYGPVVSMRLGNRLVLYLLDNDSIRDALEKQAETFSGRFDYLPMTYSNRGLGIALQDGPKWQVVRRFSQSKLRDYGMGKLSMETKIHDEISAFMHDLDSKEGEAFQPNFSLITSNVIANIVFGRRFDYDDELFQTCIESVVHNFKKRNFLVMASFNSIFKWFPQFNEETIDFMASVDKLWAVVNLMIDRKRETVDLSKDPVDFLSALLKEANSTEENRSIYYETLPAGNQTTLSIIVTQLFTAGTETTATTLEWAFLALIKNPEMQKELQIEIDDVIGRDKLPSYENRPNLPLCDSFCMEVHRFGNIGLIAIPHRTTQDTTLRGYFIPQDTVVMPLLSLVQFDPEYYKDPDEFQLRRFIGDDGKVQQRPPSFLPFSAGKRICLGDSLAKREVFLVITGLLQKYTFSSPTGIPQPTFDREYGITTRPKSFEMIAKLRSAPH